MPKIHIENGIKVLRAVTIETAYSCYFVRQQGKDADPRLLEGPLGDQKPTGSLYIPIDRH